MVYTLRFFLNAVCFIILTCLVPVLFTFYIHGMLKLKKNHSGAKRLTSFHSFQLVCPRCMQLHLRRLRFRVRCCRQIHKAAHCLKVWNLSTDVFLIIAFFATGRRRKIFCFSQVELFQYLVRIRLLTDKDPPITLTLKLHSEEVLKFSSEPIVILNSS
jgi:hypothetical protein